MYNFRVARQSKKEVAEIKEKFEKNQRELEQKEINLQKLIKENFQELVPHSTSPFLLSIRHLSA